MHVTLQENEKYREFVNGIAIEMGAFDFKGDDIVWHYTNGLGLLGIIQTSALYATQVSCLNDASETIYATDIYKKVIADLIKERHDDAEAVSFLTDVSSAPLDSHHSALDTWRYSCPFGIFGRPKSQPHKRAVFPLSKSGADGGDQPGIKGRQVDVNRGGRRILVQSLLPARRSIAAPGKFFYCNLAHEKALNG